jgi:hypothetical protein
MRTLLVLASALAASSALADTVEATSTTYVSTGRQTRGGLPGQAPELVTVMPVIEVLSVSARDIRNPVFDDLGVVVSTWGSADLQENRWDSGTTGTLTGDVMTGYVQGRLFSRRLTLRVGRENVAIGAGRVASIDGGDFALRLPLGIGISAYAGAPVAQRFSSRGALVSWNALGGDLAYGGRLSLSALNRVDVGASAAFVDDGGEAVRRDVGVDARVRILGDLALNAYGLYALEAEQIAEIQALAGWHPVRKLFVTVDYRHTNPTLMLPMTSILTVFSESKYDELGGGFRYELTHALELGVDYHALVEPGEDGTGTKLGHDAALRGDYTAGPVRAGAELTVLQTSENTVGGFRGYVRREIGRFFGSGELIAYGFDEAINGRQYSASLGATAGYKLGDAWTASVSARAAVTPFMDQQVDVMAKLAYNQTYRVREVR